MKRVLILTDEELDLIVAWAEHVRDEVLHDFEDEDAAVLAKVEAQRLAA